MKWATSNLKCSGPGLSSSHRSDVALVCSALSWRWQVWRQHSNPCELHAVEGYIPVSVPHTGFCWGGLKLDDRANRCLIHGSSGDGNAEGRKWFFALGTFKVLLTAGSLCTHKAAVNQEWKAPFVKGQQGGPRTGIPGCGITSQPLEITSQLLRDN